MAKRKHTHEWMLARVKEYLNGEGSYGSIAKSNGIAKHTLQMWVSCYKEHGPDALLPKTGNTNYSKELKILDKRGHHKTDDEVDELERLRRENLRLKRQLQERDMTVELLKKVKELEGM